MKKEIRDILRSPGKLEVLYDKDGIEFLSESGERYPIIEGIVCLLKDAQRVVADNSFFYDSNPFGARDWSNESDVILGVEDDLKNLLKEFTTTSLIIDVGSGAGRISNYLSLKGYQNAISLDYSHQSLKQVKDNSKNVCIWGDVLCLPIESDSVDLVICTGVIHHTPNPHKALEECVRILKPEGRLYLRTYNRNSFYYFLYRTYGAGLRLFESSKRTRFLSDIFGFELYKLIRKTFKSLPASEEKVLRAKYANLFLKDTVYFFSELEIENLLKKHEMEIEDSKKTGLAHRSHCYVARKKS